MEYKGTLMTDALSVTEIYTVLRPELSKLRHGEGESHPFPEIIYLSEGEHILIIDETEYELRAGQMVIYAPNSYHDTSERSSGTATAYILTFNAVSHILPQLYNRVITLTPTQRQMLGEIISVGCDSFRDRPPEDKARGMLLTERTETHTLWRLKKHVEFFLMDVYETHPELSEAHSRRECSSDREFRMAEAYLRDRLTEQISVSDIAAGCSMSISKLKHLFHEKTGGGPMNYRNLLRIEEAKRLINNGSMNFTEITGVLDFSSLHYFSRSFKKVTGTAPSEYAHRKKQQ